MSHPPVTLSRRDLEEHRMRAIYVAALDPGRALSDEALADSLAATLAKKPAGSGWWVFAYGSLLWNPLFPFADARPASLHGLHRHFCLWSMGSRGTVKVPGLVLGLDRGGSCHGVAYRLPARCARAELELLWRREMVVGSYRPRWLQVHSSGHSLTALAFVVDRSHPQYAGRLALARQARVLATAQGVFGSSADYLERARVALVTHGIVDPYLEQLAVAVARLRRKSARPRAGVGATDIRE
jgi:glutathione-specific gamma-glutamylcyclotransferase